MSYGRRPYYIWSDGETMHFWCIPSVPDEDGITGGIHESAINALVYKLLLRNRRGELGRRLREGKRVWLSGSDEDSKKWMESQEDDILRSLMAAPPEDGLESSATEDVKPDPPAEEGDD